MGGGQSRCITSHYHKSGYSDILEGVKERCNKETAIMIVYEQTDNNRL